MSSDAEHSRRGPAARSPNLAAALRIPFQEISARIVEGLTAAGYSDLRLSHGTVFQHLPSEGGRLTDVAARAQLTKQTVAAFVDEMIEMGYLERVPDPTDARARLLRYTRKGRTVRRKAASVIRDIEVRWAEHLGKQKMAELRKLLDELIAAIGSEAAGAP